MNVSFKFVLKNNKENIQKQYFTISREELFKDCNDAPAILKCLGKKLIINNKTTLKTNQRHILKNGDVININDAQKSFKFIDQRSETWKRNLYSSEVTDQYWIGKVLGSGATGEVRLVHEINTLKKFAIKTFKKKSKSFVEEVATLRELNHFNILMLMRVIETPLHNHLLAEYMNAGDLLDLIRSSPSRRLSEAESKFAMHQIAMGLVYLHEVKNFAHLDLKLENIFISHRSGVRIYKIADFGLSSRVDKISSKWGTFCYNSPEIVNLQPDGFYSGKQSDMWSLGVLLYACLSGALPFSRKNGDVSTQISTANLQFRQEVWTTISCDALEVIKQLIQLNPMHRLTASQLTTMVWFNDEALHNRLTELYKFFELVKPAER